MVHVQDKILPVKRLAGKEVRTIPGVDNWKKCCPRKRDNIVYTVSTWAGRVWLLPLGIILFEDTLYVLQEEMPEHLTILYR